MLDQTIFYDFVQSSRHWESKLCWQIVFWLRPTFRRWSPPGPGFGEIFGTQIQYMTVQLIVKWASGNSTKSKADCKGKYCPSVVTKFGDKSCLYILALKLLMHVANNANEAGDVELE